MLVPPAPLKLLLRLPTAFFLVGQFAPLGLLTIVVLLIVISKVATGVLLRITREEAQPRVKLHGAGV